MSNTQPPPLTAFIQYYNSQPPTPNTYRFYIRGTNFYFIHFNEAHVICHLLQLPQQRVNPRTDVPFLKLTENEFNAAIVALLSQQTDAIITVELYNRDDDKQNNWYIVKQGTNSNWHDFAHLNANTMQIDDTIPNIIDKPLKYNRDMYMAVRASTQASQRIIGIATCINTQTDKRLMCGQFIDNDKFVNLFNYLTDGTNELPALCYIAVDSRANNELQINALINMFTELDVKIQTVLLKDFGGNIADDLLPQLCSNAEQHIYITSQKYAMSSLSCLIDKRHLNNTAELKHTFTLHSVNLQQYAALDKSAREALNLFSVKSESFQITNKSSKTENYDTLYGLFNRVKLGAAERLLHTYMAQPLTSVEQIERRLNYVELLVEDSNVRNLLLQQVLRGIQDIQQNVRQLTSSKATLKNVVVLYQIVQNKLPQLIHTLQLYQGKHVQLLHNEFVIRLQELQTVFVAYCEMVRRTIDVEDIQHVIRINPHQDVDLLKLDNSIQECDRSMIELCNRYTEQINATVTKTNDKKYGYCMRVTRSMEAKLKQIKGFERVTSVKSAVKFVTPEFVRIKQHYDDLQAKYVKQQSAYTLKVIEIAQTYAIPFDNLNDFFAEIAVFVDMAHVAAIYRYVRPKVLPMGSGRLELKQSRHPCLEALDQSTVVANDVLMVRDMSNVQIITGPNMGGKSTYIRQIGVIVLMAQMGSFVPCQSAEITVVDSILSRVGAGDMMLKGVSTFYKEMLEAKVMVTNATKNSLLIVDELGRGTSTSDGYGLAYGLAQYIATELGAFAFFATHFHELSQLSQQLHNVKNLHVECVVESNHIVMKYTVAAGASSQSYGVHVAETADFPTEVVETAREKSIDLEEKMRLLAMRNNYAIVQSGDDIFVNDSLNEDAFKQIELTALSNVEPNNCSREEYNQFVNKFLNEIPV